METDPKVLEHLNAQVKCELTAVTQYFVHYRMYDHWGLDRLAKKEREVSIDEMHHLDKLMKRIFMLDGLPNLQDQHKLLIGENVKEALECDLQLEYAAQAACKTGMDYCDSVRDYVSRDLLKELLIDTEDHIDHLETQLGVIEKVGIENYIQSQTPHLDEK